jgi:Zn finger protein HypA/HybF involved in hydrogenase expression
MKEWQAENGDKTKASVKKWQEKNIVKVREINNLAKQKRSYKHREFINEYKAKCSCSKCGENRSYVLDFHHIDPTQKSFNLGDASKYSFEKVELELEKCITLCRNCHSEFHHFEKEQGVTIENYLSI